MAGLPLRKAPYKDFLQPALQRRFASTALVLLAVSYLEAILLSGFNSLLWTWFPIGPTGIRAAFIFLCGLAILVLRIAHYHVGLRTTGSVPQTLYTVLAQAQTYETVFWYCFSSSVFAPVFLWSASESANLNWITYFSGDRARLNERPIFLAVYLGVCALWQSFEHYAADVDQLDLSVLKRKKADGSVSAVSLQTFVFEVPKIFVAGLSRSLWALPASLILYYGIFRNLTWAWALMWLRLFYNLPKTNILPPSWPTDFYLLIRCLVAGTLLFFLWAAGNTAFSAFMGEEPLKNGQPLTSESKDPNGSLLNGLKSKKLSIKAFAVSELAHIATGFEARRQAIYADIDRKDGPVWSQVYAICMELLKSIELRVDDYNRPPAPAQPLASAPIERQRISAPLKNDPIMSPSKAAPKTLGSGIRQAVGEAVYAPGAPAATPLSPMAKKTWEEAKGRVMNQEQVTQKLKQLQYFSTYLNQDFRREFAGAVLGRPHAEPALYSNAAKALSRLAVHSLKEDQYGNVHRDVSSIIRTLTSVIRKVEAFKQIFPTQPNELRRAPEVDEVMDALRTGLQEVVAAFEPYAHDLRLSQGDLRLAKEAGEKPQEKVEEPPKPKAVEEKGKAREEPRRPTESRTRSRDEVRRVDTRRRARTEMEQVR